MDEQQRYLKNVLAQHSMDFISIEPYTNPYAGSAAKPLFRVNCKENKSYIAKVITGSTIGKEYNGYAKFSNHIPTPNLLFRDLNKKEGIEVLLYEFYPSISLCDAVQDCDTSKNSIDFLLEVESSKNEKMLEVYKNTLSQTTKKEWLQAPLNELFCKKLFGDVFNEYYSSDKPISNFMSKKLVLNGFKFEKTGFEIIENIKKKLKNYSSDFIADCVLGHGDLHHMNVLKSNSSDWKIIDFEYFSNVPLAMELSKPYYIDFVGTLFFFFQNSFTDRFDFKNKLDAINNSKDLKLDITLTGSLDNRILITQNKVKCYKDILKGKKDFLTFNEYIILCHLLSHNPNNYTHKAQILFIAFLHILDVFEWEKPESVLSFFK